MKLWDLKIGDEVTAIVVDVLDATEVLLRVGSGEEVKLVRVANESRHVLRIDDHVRLRVSAIRPLRFQYLAPSGDLRRQGRIDVSV